MTTEKQAGPDTALSRAMRQALRDDVIAGVGLYVAAVEALRRAGGDPERACPAFAEKIHPHLVHYLRRVAADMTSPAGGQGRGATHCQTAAAPGSPRTTHAEPPAGCGHQASGARKDGAPSAPGTERGGNGQDGRDTQRFAARAAAPDAGTGERGLGRDDSQRLVAPARPGGPTTRQRRGAVAAAAGYAATVFDNFKITERQGSKTPIGDVPVARWASIARHRGKSAWINAKEAEFALIMDAWTAKQAHVPAGALTRDIVPTDVAERAVAEATKIADYQRRITSLVGEVAHG